MGRKRTVHHDLPPHVNQKGDRLYYGREWIPLGRADNPAWLREYAKLHAVAITGAAATFQDAANHYLAHELHRRKPKTQREYARQIKKLCGVFGKMPLTTIEPVHVQTYMNKRTAKHSATREKAILSAVWNVARNAGITTAANPCIGVRGVRSKRDLYVLDDEFAAVRAEADQPTRDFLDLCYRTGADASVVLRLTRADVREGALWVQRDKTGTKVRIDVTGPLETILARQRGIASVYLVHDDRGQPLNLQAIRKRFWKARAAVGATFQIRDLRAKAGSDVGSIQDANKLLGHASEVTTAIYRRRRIGETASPVMREIAEMSAELLKSRKANKRS